MAGMVASANATPTAETPSLPKDRPWPPPPSSHPDTTTLDEILLDLAALIELSPYDRRIAESRYRRLKEHIERPSSSLRPYLVDGESLIYAQGSVATSTTVLSGDQDDRFDIDAIVEIDVPADWSDDRALDELFATLQGFPGAQKITRCTRCVQMQFAFMHMDVSTAVGFQASVAV